MVRSFVRVQYSSWGIHYCVHSGNVSPLAYASTLVAICHLRASSPSRVGGHREWKAFFFPLVLIEAIYHLWRTPVYIYVGVKYAVSEYHRRRVWVTHPREWKTFFFECTRPGRTERVHKKACLFWTHQALIGPCHGLNIPPLAGNRRHICTII